MGGVRNCSRNIVFNHISHIYKQTLLYNTLIIKNKDKTRIRKQFSKGKLYPPSVQSKKILQILKLNLHHEIDLSISRSS